MTTNSRRKGHDAERAACRWLNENGYPQAVTTRCLMGTDGFSQAGKGDLWVSPDVLVEVKNCAKWEPQAWLRQAAEAAGDRLVVVWAKPRGASDPGEWIVMMRAKDFFDQVAA